MNCGEALAKYVLIIINVIFFLCGVAIATIGAIITAENQNISALVSTGVWAVSITIIIIGCIVAIITFFGCCGASKENKCMLYTYATIVGIIFVVEVGGAIAIFCYKDDAKQLLTDRLLETMKQYSNGGTKDAWDYLQQELGCCGAQNSTDWETNTQNIPESCCNMNYPGCDTQDQSLIYQTGCVDAMIDFVKTHINIIGGVALGVAVVEILGVVFSCCVGSVANKR